MQCAVSDAKKKEGGGVWGGSIRDLLEDGVMQREKCENESPQGKVNGRRKSAVGGGGGRGAGGQGGKGRQRKES